jgi:hypothetical protein
MRMSQVLQGMEAKLEPVSGAARGPRVNIAPSRIFASMPEDSAPA